MSEVAKETEVEHVGEVNEKNDENKVEEHNTNENKEVDNKKEEVEKKEENKVEENKEENKAEENKADENKMEENKEENNEEKKEEKPEEKKETEEKPEENKMEEEKKETKPMPEFNLDDDTKDDIDMNERLLGPYNYCLFCGSEPHDCTVYYLPIVNNRAGGFPIVLKLERKYKSNFICLHHFRENRKEYLEHYVQNEKAVLDEASVLYNASIVNKKILPSAPSNEVNKPEISEDVKKEFSKYIALRRQELEMAMGSVPAGLAVTSDLLCMCCNAPSHQLFDFSKFPPSFIQFLAWQRLMQIYSKMDPSNIEMINALKKEATKEADNYQNQSKMNEFDRRRMAYGNDQMMDNKLKRMPKEDLPPLSKISSTGSFQAPMTYKQERKSYPYFYDDSLLLLNMRR